MCILIHANSTSIKHKSMWSWGMLWGLSCEDFSFCRITGGRPGELWVTFCSCKEEDTNIWSQHLPSLLAMAFKTWLYFLFFSKFQVKLVIFQVTEYNLRFWLALAKWDTCMSVHMCVCVHKYLCLFIEHEEQASYFMLLSFLWP